MFQNIEKTFNIEKLGAFVRIKAKEKPSIFNLMWENKNFYNFKSDLEYEFKLLKNREHTYHKENLVESIHPLLESIQNGIKQRMHNLPKNLDQNDSKNVSLLPLFLINIRVVEKNTMKL